MKTSTSTPPMTQRHQVPGLALLLIIALLWAQMFGLAHRVLHAPPLKGAPLGAQSAGPTRHAAAPAGLLEHLLSPATGEADCRAYDQLGLTDTLPAAPALVLPALLPVLRDVPVRVTVCPPRLALFEARGPPTVR